MGMTEGRNGWAGGVSFRGLDGSGRTPLGIGAELWVRFRIYMPDGFDYGVYSAGDTLKFVRLHITGATDAYWDWQLRREGSSSPYGTLISHNDCSSYSDCWQFFGTTAEQPIRQVWETFEMYVKVHNVPVDEGGEARARVWKNGVLIGDLTRHRTINDPGDIVDTWRFGDYWNGGAPRDQHLYFDDLVITNERPSAMDLDGNPYIGMGDFEPGVPAVDAGAGSTDAGAVVDGAVDVDAGRGPDAGPVNDGGSGAEDRGSTDGTMSGGCTVGLGKTTGFSWLIPGVLVLSIGFRRRFGT